MEQVDSAQMLVALRSIARMDYGNQYAKGCADAAKAAIRKAVPDSLLQAEMQHSARRAVSENLRMDSDRLFYLLGLWFPEATDEEVEAVVKEVL